MSEASFTFRRHASAELDLSIHTDKVKTAQLIIWANGYHNQCYYFFSYIIDVLLHCKTECEILACVFLCLCIYIVIVNG